MLNWRKRCAITRVLTDNDSQLNDLIRERNKCFEQLEYITFIVMGKKRDFFGRMDSNPTYIALNREYRKYREKVLDYINDYFLKFPVEITEKEVILDGNVQLFEEEIDQVKDNIRCLNEQKQK